MIRTRRSSVIPDARFLIEEWEREAAGHDEPPSRPPLPVSPTDRAMRLALVVLVLLLVGKWLCGC